MPVASRKNTVAEGESPISSVKYNEEIDNLYFNLNKSLSFHSGALPPDEPLSNQYWLDTGVTPAVLRRFEDGVWRWTGVHFGATVPANPVSGAFFINSEEGTMAYWDGDEEEWVSLPGTAIGFDPGDTDLTATNMQDALLEVFISYPEILAQANRATNAVGRVLGFVTQATDARDAAQTARSAAEAAQDIAENARDIAQGCSGKAEGSAELAEKWAADGENVEVGNGKFSAFHYATKAATAADKAKAWADGDEGVPVVGVRFSAKHHAAKARQSASDASQSSNASLGYRDDAKEFAQEARDAAEAATASSIPLWDSDETYNFPDVVVANDTHTYRCIGTDVTSEPSEASPDWLRQRLSLLPLGTFEYDSNDDLMPASPPHRTYWWDIDDDGDIMLIA